jgi:hypothetical protein
VDNCVRLLRKKRPRENALELSPLFPAS